MVLSEFLSNFLCELCELCGYETEFHLNYAKKGLATEDTEATEGSIEERTDGKK